MADEPTNLTLVSFTVIMKIWLVEGFIVIHVLFIININIPLKVVLVLVDYSRSVLLKALKRNR